MKQMTIEMKIAFSDFIIENKTKINQYDIEFLANLIENYEYGPITDQIKNEDRFWLWLDDLEEEYKNKS